MGGKMLGDRLLQAFTLRFKGSDGVDAPQRPWCAKVEVLSTT